MNSIFFLVNFSIAVQWIMVQKEWKCHNRKIILFLSVCSLMNNTICFSKNKMLYKTKIWSKVVWSKIFDQIFWSIDQTVDQTFDQKSFDQKAKPIFWNTNHKNRFLNKLL